MCINLASHAVNVFVAVNKNPEITDISVLLQFFIISYEWMGECGILLLSQKQFCIIWKEHKS